MTESIRILTTGSRYFNDPQTISVGLMYAYTAVADMRELPSFAGLSITVLHGGASGADNLVHLRALEWGWDIEEHPAYWKEFNRAAGPIRNQKMVEAGADVAVAFLTRHACRGTWDMVRRAYTAQIPVFVFYDSEKIYRWTPDFDPTTVPHGITAAGT